MALCFFPSWTPGRPTFSRVMQIHYSTTNHGQIDKLKNKIKLAANNSEKIRSPRLMKEGGRLIVTGKKDANQINELLG